MYCVFIAPKRTTWIFVILLAILLIIVRLPSLSMPLDNDSGANAFFARYMLRGGTLYDVFHPAHHLPGIYYTFELAFRLFGDNPNAPKLLLFPLALVCALLIYYTGRMCFGEQTGKLAAIFFVLVSSQRWVAGQTVEMEHFANLPLILGFFLLIILLRQDAPAWKFSWLGILGALAILYKVLFVAPLIVAGLSIPLMAWINHKENGSWKAMLYRLIWLAVGCIIPLAFVAAYFASLGLWERFLLVFKFGFTYFNDPHLMNGWMLPPPFGFPLVSMSVNNAVLLVLGLLGTYRLVRRSIRLKSMENLMELIVVLWLVVSFASAGSRGGGFPYYLLPTVPPLVLTASFEINSIYQLWKATSVKSANLWRSTSIALVVGFFLWSNLGMYSNYVMYKFAVISYDDFLRNLGEAGLANYDLSNYIRVHTEPSDYIYLWCNRVEAYYYADRLPPIDILWPSYVGATGSPNRIFGPHTKYIVLDKSGELEIPQWLTDGLSANYKLETIVDDREIYRRNSP